MENEEKKEKVDPGKKPEIPDKVVLPKLRRIVIETDGNLANVVEAQVAGNFEFIAILQGLIDKVKQQ